MLYSTRPNGWTELDRIYLEYLVLSGLDDHEIAPKLDRAVSAIRYQRQFLKLRGPRGNKRAGRRAARVAA